MDKEIAIEAKDLVFSYKRNVPLIDHLNLSLYKGETAVLEGSNGVGKTTLGKLLTGILKPFSGKIYLFGDDANHIPLWQIGQKVGYSFQNPEKQLFAATVEEEITFGLKYQGVSQEEMSRITDSLLTLLEIEHLRKVFPLNLSWGEKRRVGLAAILALEPAYLVLDEATIGLDEEKIGTLNQVLGRLREKSVGILLISHNLSFIQRNAQRILRMKEGVIVDDRYC